MNNTDFDAANLLQLMAESISAATGGSFVIKGNTLKAWTEIKDCDRTICRIQIEVTETDRGDDD